jgi:hypothetical protein
MKDFISRNLAMLTCQACVRQYLQTFVRDLHQVSISSRSKPTHSVSRRSARSYTSFAAKIHPGTATKSETAPLRIRMLDRNGLSPEVSGLLGGRKQGWHPASIEKLPRSSNTCRTPLSWPILYEENFSKTISKTRRSLCELQANIHNASSAGAKAP